MSPHSEHRHISLVDRFYPMENPSCRDPSFSIDNPECNPDSFPPDGTDNFPPPEIWQPSYSPTSSYGPTPSDSPDNSNQSGSSSNYEGDKPQQIGQIPNGTTLINGTSTHDNYTAIVPNSSSATKDPSPDNGSSAALSIIGGDINHNNETTANVTAASSNSNSTNHVSASVLVPAILVPLFSLVLISIILYLLRSCWQKRQAKKDAKKSMVRSEPDEFGSTTQFTNGRTNMEQPIDMLPVEPAYRAWISPQVTQPQPSYAQNNQISHWSNINLGDDSRREMSPVSAYVPSINDSRGSRRGSVVSALDYTPAQPRLPTLEDGHGHFMSSNFDHQDYYTGPTSHQSMDNIDSFLSPRQEVHDHWRALGGSGIN